MVMSSSFLMNSSPAVGGYPGAGATIVDPKFPPAEEYSQSNYIPDYYSAAAAAGANVHSAAIAAHHHHLAQQHQQAVHHAHHGHHTHHTGSHTTPYGYHHLNHYFDQNP